MTLGQGVVSLIPGSDNLNNLPGPTEFPYRAIATYATTYTHLEQTLDVLLGRTGGTTVDTLLTAQNDVIVPLDSQTDGGIPTRVFKGRVHSDTPLSDGLAILNAQNVINDVACALRNGSTCQGNLKAVTLSPMAEASLAAPGDIDLTGYQQVAPTGISLSRSPSGKLLLGTEYYLTVNVVNPNVKGIRYLLEDGTARGIGKMAYAGETITMKPVSLDPVKLTVIVVYLNNTYAVKSWSFPQNTVIKAVVVSHEPEVIRLAGVGATYQLRPEAYLDTPHQGKLTVAAQAVYSVVTGTANVSVRLNGTVKALKPGQAEVLIQFGGAETKVRVIVDPT